MASRADGSWQDAVKRGAVRGGTLTGAVLLLAFTLALGFALVSYRATDGSLNTAAGGMVHNWIGAPGAWTADILLTLFGPAAALWLPVMIVLALRLWRDSHPAGWKRQLGGTLLAIALFAAAIGIFVGGEASGLPAGYGGIIGMLAAKGDERGRGADPRSRLGRPRRLGGRRAVRRHRHLCLGALARAGRGRARLSVHAP